MKIFKTRPQKSIERVFCIKRLDNVFDKRRIRKNVSECSFQIWYLKFTEAGGRQMNSNRHIVKMINAKWQEGKFLGVGLDIEFRKIPRVVIDDDGKVNVCKTMVDYATQIIWATHDIVCVYLINHYFYWAKGIPGILALKEIISRIHAIAPNVPILLNNSEGDIGNSNLAIIEYAFGELDLDGITINPWFGQEALQPFLNLPQKGIVVVCRTSNFGSEEFQCLKISDHESVSLFKTVAWRVSQFWNKNGNCALQFGVRSCADISLVREIVPDMPIFVQGVGPQSKTGTIEEDDVREIIVAGRHNTILCSARGVIFSPDPRKEATRLHHLISKYRAAELAAANA
ncbi:MAG: orotidine-5'-phosphate decarboxylase [Candidatus Staskawiczbacteria bacterium]|nr:orotidine-5'-phosphate decarboxylase [Candidatus Staskawiczbacteria bacterium]